MSIVLWLAAGLAIAGDPQWESRLIMVKNGAPSYSYVVVLRDCHEPKVRPASHDPLWYDCRFVDVYSRKGKRELLVTVDRDDVPGTGDEAVVRGRCE